MNSAIFNLLRRLAREYTGTVLTEEKDYFIAARLSDFADSVGLPQAQVVAEIEREPCGVLAMRAVQALLVTETSFFRDSSAFDALRRQVLPSLLEARKETKTLNIWSAACSTGQEIYSVAMLLEELLPSRMGWSIQLLATDISSDLVRAAQSGTYSHLEVNRGLPARLLVKHFVKESVSWRISDVLRGQIEFRQMNILDPWPTLPKMDLVLLRNVLIYFESPDKRQVLRCMRSVLREDGHLLLGGAETTVFLDDAYSPTPYGTYRLRREDGLR